MRHGGRNGDNARTIRSVRALSPRSRATAAVADEERGDEAGGADDGDVAERGMHAQRRRFGRVHAGGCGGHGVRVHDGDEQGDRDGSMVWRIVLFIAVPW